MEYTDAHGNLLHYSGIMDYGNGVKVMGKWKDGRVGLTRKGDR